MEVLWAGAMDVLRSKWHFRGGFPCRRNGLGKHSTPHAHPMGHSRSAAAFLIGLAQV